MYSLSLLSHVLAVKLFIIRSSLSLNYVFLTLQFCLCIKKKNLKCLELHDILLIQFDTSLSDH